MTVTEERIELHEVVLFMLGKANIEQESFGLLDQVAEAVNADSEIGRIELQGQTDAGRKGRPRKVALLSPLFPLLGRLSP